MSNKPGFFGDTEQGFILGVGCCVAAATIFYTYKYLKEQFGNKSYNRDMRVHYRFTGNHRNTWQQPNIQQPTIPQRKTPSQ